MAEACGVQVGWEVLAVNNEPVSNTQEFNAVAAVIKANEGGQGTVAEVTFRVGMPPDVQSQVSMGSGSQGPPQQPMGPPPVGAIINIPMDFSQKFGWQHHQ